MTGESPTPTITPVAPSSTATVPFVTQPAASAASIGDALPAPTCTISETPHSRASAGRSKPRGWSEAPMGGSSEASCGSMKSNNSADHLRVRMSSRPVPDALPGSVARSPVSQ